MRIGIFTNGVYNIMGISCNNRIIGIITKTSYTYIYKLYQLVDLPLYHLEGDTKPQFIKKNERLNKANI